MNIVIFSPAADFTKEQQEQLAQAGTVTYSESPMEHPPEYFINLAKDADVIGIDPDNVGGFEGANEKVTAILEGLPKLKGVALSTTSFGWIDREYCRKRNIDVTNIPGYSRESVAEHTLALLLCLAKRILITDRRTQKGAYKMELGFELKGKTLGIIGIGNIGSRLAELARGIGMQVIAYNRTPTKAPGVSMKSLDEVLQESDAIAFHVTHEDANMNMMKATHLAKMKNGVILVNTADRGIIDEAALAAALRSGKIYGYAYEGSDLINTPLAGIENAIGLKGFGWYTRESLKNLYQIWVNSMIALAKGAPINVVN